MYKAIFWYGVVPVILGAGVKILLEKKNEQELKNLPYVTIKPVKWKVTAENN